MKCFVAGHGEVGTAVAEVLRRAHEVVVFDPYKYDDTEPSLADVDVLHICFPCKDQATFVAYVRNYTRFLRPEAVTIIHSTVPIGTTRAIGGRVVHSPIHGVHPNIDKGILTFIKLVGGCDAGAVEVAVRCLQDCNVLAVRASNPESSELSKLCCTLQYGINIIVNKCIHDLCELHGADFSEVYTYWNTQYNIGYRFLGMSHVERSVLDYHEGQIGGHCVIPNAKLLPGPLSEFLLRMNDLQGVGLIERIMMGSLSENEFLRLEVERLKKRLEANGIEY